MDTAIKSPVILYTEQTPNPESLKFVSNRMLYKGTADFKVEEFARTWSPLAAALYDFPYIKSVYICNNFVTVTKEFTYEWSDIMLPIKSFLKTYVEEENPILNEGFEEEVARIEAEVEKNISYEGNEAELVQKIKSLIETYVKPAVEMDGGNIEFKSFKNGKVTVILQGSCSGCPSSTVTLKSGIEGMLTRMVPEVKEVISEMG